MQRRQKNFLKYGDFTELKLPLEFTQTVRIILLFFAIPSNFVAVRLFH